MAEMMISGRTERDSTGASCDCLQGNQGFPKSHSLANRKEKRKEAKKVKRKRMRKELATKEREEEEERLNDPEEQLRMRLKEQEESEIADRERRLFEEREAIWLETARKAKEEAERRLLEESHREPVECEIEDDSWEYIEEGPAEIIWQGNEIIVKKKKVKVPKRSIDQQQHDETTSRPTSNPLPPQSAAFDDYKKATAVSTQALFDSVAQQVPNFGTEQDKAHCPFHFKTGACRFGSRCSRVHFYPDKSCTLLIKNMYGGPGLAWEQDEGLEYTEEEVERYFEEFYEDVHTEFLKYGQIVNFKVCRNGSSHLRGNVYVHYKHLESAVLAYNSLNGRFFAGKQITCDFVGVTRWRVAICGEYMKSKHKTCSRGSACNFIHCFRNPGGEYEWADWDNRPPKYWVEKMLSLFGPSARDEDEEGGKDEELVTSKKVPRHSRHHSSRSQPRDRHNVDGDPGMENSGENGRFHHCGVPSNLDYHRNQSSTSKTEDFNGLGDHKQSHEVHDWSGHYDREHSDKGGSFSDRKHSKKRAHENRFHCSAQGVEAYRTDCERPCEAGYLGGDAGKECSDEYDRAHYGRSSSGRVHRHHSQNGSILRRESLQTDDFDRSQEQGCKSSDSRWGHSDEDGGSRHVDHSSREKPYRRSHGSSQRSETWGSDYEEHGKRLNSSRASTGGSRLGSRPVEHSKDDTYNDPYHENVDFSEDFIHERLVHDRIVSGRGGESSDDPESPGADHGRQHPKHLSSPREKKLKRTEASQNKRDTDVEDLDDLKPGKRISGRGQTAYDRGNSETVGNERLTRRTSKHWHRRYSYDEASDWLRGDYGTSGGEKSG